MIWSLAGVALSVAVAAAAWRCSRSHAGFYAGEVYAMDAAAHRRYAVVSSIFAAFFVVASARGLVAAGIGGLALYSLVAIFYAASFARGAADE